MTSDDSPGARPSGSPSRGPGATAALCDEDPILHSDEAEGSGPRLFHPLLGSSLSNLARLLRHNGPVPVRRTPHVAIALTSALLRWPFGALERLGTSLADGGDPSPPPVFIVGHWRSGTTHLYNLLTRSPDFGFVRPLQTGLPWEFLGLGRLLQPLLERALPSDRFVDRLPVRPDSPQEDEAALANMQDLSFYHGLYFPRHFRRNFGRGIFFQGCSEPEVRRWERCFTHFLRKVSVRERGRRLLIKNPVYTGRVARLRSLLPGAKFIHVYRNPYVVFQSTRHFYRALFRELALQDWREAPVDQVILESYPRMMTALLEDASELAEDEYVEVRFETLLAEPFVQLRRIYEGLGLSGYERAREGFSAYLDSVSEYRTNRYAFPPAALRAVEESWGEFVERWGYARPASAASGGGAGPAAPSGSHA